MKKIYLFLTIVIISLVQTGCFLRSVHPLVTSEEAILVEGLEGIWESQNHRWTFINDPQKFPNLLEYIGGKTTVDFERNIYMILIQNLNDTSATVNEVYVGKAINLNNAYFMDLQIFMTSIETLDAPSSIFMNGEFLDVQVSMHSIKSNNASPIYMKGEFVDWHFFPVHTFSKISLKENQLNIEFFETSFIEKLISANRIRIKHEKTDDSILITASTNELKKIVEKYAHEEDAFENALEYTFKGFIHE